MFNLPSDGCLLVWSCGCGERQADFFIGGRSTCEKRPARAYEEWPLLLLAPGHMAHGCMCVRDNSGCEVMSPERPVCPMEGYRMHPLHSVDQTTQQNKLDLAKPRLQRCKSKKAKTPVGQPSVRWALPPTCWAPTTPSHRATGHRKLKIRQDWGQ